MRKIKLTPRAKLDKWCSWLDNEMKHGGLRSPRYLHVINNFRIMLEEYIALRDEIARKKTGGVKK